MDEFVVEEDRFLWNEVEELLDIRDIRGLLELDDERMSLVLVQAIFKSVSKGLFQLVHDIFQK